jgi:hypothetical protein
MYTALVVTCFVPCCGEYQQNIFTKKKTEKKESSQRGGEAKKPKGNGISAEGWQGKKI